MKSASAQRIAAVLLSLSTAPACAATPSAAPVAEVTAFAGAEGAGRYSLGGRGGAVLKVTNLDDAGPGSLRAAVEAKGPRTIVFAVAGTIALKTPLKISQGRVTLAGQTAPGGGITLRDQTLVVAADDVVNRFIRSRLGAESKTEGDAIWVAKGRRIILDHVSASWSVDETLSASARFDPPENGFYDLTVQWSIISESLAHSVHAKGDHGYGSLIRGGRGSKISFHHNLWANHLARMPRPGNYDGPDKDPVGAFIEFRSNVFYNWGKGHAGYDADKAALVAYNFIDNAYVMGPNSEKPIAFNEKQPGQGVLRRQQPERRGSGRPLEPGDRPGGGRLSPGRSDRHRSHRGRSRRQRLSARAGRGRGFGGAGRGRRPGRGGGAGPDWQDHQQRAGCRRLA